MRVIIFGAGSCGRAYVANIERNIEIVAVCDNNWQFFVNDTLFGHKICDPKTISEMDFDFVLITINDDYDDGIKAIINIRTQLLLIGVDESKILLVNEYDIDRSTFLEKRVSFLYRLAELPMWKNIEGNAAECGVFRGNFSCKINEIFPSKTLYLFDTFTGFDKTDIEREKDFTNALPDDYIDNISRWLQLTNIETVRLKHKYRHKGISINSKKPN